jgi:hypothetical protein
LILFHLPDSIDFLAHHLARCGRVASCSRSTLMVAPSEPPVQLVTTIRNWVEGAFRSAGANPVIGARLALLLRRAGAVDVTSFGVQTHLAPLTLPHPTVGLGFERAEAVLDLFRVRVHMAVSETTPHRHG